MLVYTLKRAAGAICFAPDETIDVPDEMVQDLINAGAIQLLESTESKPQADPPKKGKKAKNDGPNTDS
jgi:hypothetical protein